MWQNYIYTSSDTYVLVIIIQWTWEVYKTCILKPNYWRQFIRTNENMLLQISASACVLRWQASSQARCSQFVLTVQQTWKGCSILRPKD